MNRKTIVITGASDGIGKEAARVLKSRGENVIIIGRSPAKTKQTAKELNVNYYIADFSRLSEVRELAEKLNNDLDRIDVLVNNAGAIMSDREVTVDGNEKTLQVNHLSSFLLTNLLMEKLIKSKAVVINTSSIANRLLSDFNIKDLNLNKGYTPAKAYGNSKLANILFTKQLNKLYKNKGVSAVAFHPGTVATSFSKESSSLFMKIFYRSPLRRLLVSPSKGADTLVWLAESIPNKDWELGGYYEKKRIARTAKEAQDEDLANELWEKSLKMVKLIKQ